MVNNSLILYIEEGKTNYVLTQCIFYFKIKLLFKITVAEFDISNMLHVEWSDTNTCYGQ